MDRFERIWGTIEDWIMGAFAASALALICYEVVARYFFPSMLKDWGSEVIIYFTVWAMLIAGGQLVLSARHIRADLVIRRLPERLQRALELFNLVVGLLYCGLVAKFGYDVVIFARMIDERSESSIQFPMWIFYIALPLAFGLMAIRYCLRLYRFVFRFDSSMLASAEHLEDRLEKSRS